MTPEQEIRAVAIQSAAKFCAPISNVSDGQIAALEDVLFVADVFYGYVQGGWEEALRINSTSAKQEEPAVRSVELREESPPTEDILLPELESPPVQDSPTRTLPPPAEPGPREADVIPIEARGTVTKQQSSARKAVDRIKRQRAEQILNLARVAKAEENKQRLRDDAEDAGLERFVMNIDGRQQELGAYLASL